MEVNLHVDGADQVLLITAQQLTVREMLAQLGIVLGPLDRVEPDLYMPVATGMRVIVTRVEESFETERQALPFAHQTVRNERVPEGERRLLQTGSNGELEITYRVVVEDGVEVSHDEVHREVIAKPVDEIVLVGTQVEFQSVPLSGTIMYLSGGNAWLMRESSDLRRNVTGSGDLDGRVFALAPGGNRLLFTRATVSGDDAPLNSLWLAQPSLVGEEPKDLGISGVIWAEWASDGRRFAYSTAERVGGVPGWKANNDLWLGTLGDEPSAAPKVEQLLKPTADIPYAWWGRSYAWSPDGGYLAYAQADQVGILSLTDRILVPLFTFPVLETASHWAWVPAISWSPDGYLLAFTVHQPDLDGTSPEDSPVFDLVVASVDGRLHVRLAEEVGMWAGPCWAPSGSGLLAYGQAQSPRNSQDSRYDLYVVDRDGSNAQLLFPQAASAGWLGLIAPGVAWSPTGDNLLVVYEGNLYRLDVRQGRADQLTSDGQSSQPRWSR